MDKRLLGTGLGVATYAHIDDNEMVIEEVGDAQEVLDLMLALRNSGAIVEDEVMGRYVGSIDPVIMQGLKKKYPELNYLDTPEGRKRLCQVFRDMPYFAASDKVALRGF